MRLIFKMIFWPIILIWKFLKWVSLVIVVILIELVDFIEDLASGKIFNKAVENSEKIERLRRENAELRHEIQDLRGWIEEE